MTSAEPRRGARALRVAAACLLMALGSSAPAAASDWEERADWKRFFDEAGVRGTIAVVDERTGARMVFDEGRSRARFIPASTFKIPHALFALDAGLVRDEFQVFAWDGTPHEIRSWNRDHDLRSSMRHSVVWLYQDFARRLGAGRERAFLKRIGYGNADVSGGIDRFWLDGGLRISALEEIVFLQRLHRNALPFRVEHQRLVKDTLILEAGPDWILRAKTGWGARMDPQIGWWVGWVERPEGAVFFALNIDMPEGGGDAPKRLSIARAVLRSIDALPKP
jgi:beta-lactamase class D